MELALSTRTRIRTRYLSEAHGVGYEHLYESPAPKHADKC